VARAGIVQEIVRFVDNDAMRQAGAPPHLVQRREGRTAIVPS
jgi:hypothetical protein